MMPLVVNRKIYYYLVVRSLLDGSNIFFFFFDLYVKFFHRILTWTRGKPPTGPYRSRLERK